MNDQSLKKNYPLGFWDLSISPMTIGGLLTLLAELKVLGERHKSSHIELGIIGIGENTPKLSKLLGDNGWISLTDKSLVHEDLMLSMIFDMEGVKTCHLFQTGFDVKTFLHQTSHNYITWPSLTQEGRVDYEYNYTHLIQKFFTENGYIPTISSKQQSYQWAKNFIERNIFPSIPVVVHLKNKIRESGKPDWYNADLKEWQGFFEVAESRYCAKFILIGNEPIPDEMRALPNIIVAQDFDSNLLRDLALIPLSYAFMGMASGPSNMAIFNRVPYIIYKNPYHHVEMMKKELGNSDHFVFATPYQRFYRRFETKDDILSEFDCIWKNNSTSSWQYQFSSQLDLSKV